jgi:hypothetical protein
MRRREFIAGLGSAAAWPAVARGESVRRIGVLMSGDENEEKTVVSAFTQALAGLGWTDGRNVRMDLRWGGGDINQIRALAQDLVGLQPDIILTRSTPATVVDMWMVGERCLPCRSFRSMPSRRPAPRLRRALSPRSQKHQSIHALAAAAT